VAVAKEFLLLFSLYYAYPFMTECYIGTTDLWGVLGDCKNGEFVKTQRRCHIILQPLAPSFSVLSSHSYHVYIMDLL